jgi:hypothetical protein
MLLSVLFTTVAALLAQVHADCLTDTTDTIQMAGHTYTVGDIITDTALCHTHDVGTYVFSMLVSIETTGMTYGNMGQYAQGSAFMFLDETCLLRSIHLTPSTCSIPWTFEDNFLPLVGTVNQVDTGVGEAYFAFLYGDGAYVTKDTGYCATIGSVFTTALQGCQTEFPLNGINGGNYKKKRAISFEA